MVQYRTTDYYASNPLLYCFKKKGYMRFNSLRFSYMQFLISVTYWPPLSGNLLHVFMAAVSTLYLRFGQHPRRRIGTYI